jgi:hypothetical protein
MDRPPLSSSVDDAVHYLAVAVGAIMWGLLVVVAVSALTAVAYGGEGGNAMLLVLWPVRSLLWIPIAVWALLAPRSRGLLKWGWAPTLCYMMAYAWLGWLQFGSPTINLGLS